MRATEALHLSNPETVLDADTYALMTHVDHKKHRNEIIEARKQNRTRKKVENMLWDMQMRSRN